MKPNVQKKKGFTLIELMIVVTAIGIMAAIAAPKMANLLAKSKEAKVKANLGVIRGAVNLYYASGDGNHILVLDDLAIGAVFIDAIPDMNIPSVPGQGNPGHANIEGGSTTLDDTVSGAWYYQPTGGAEGTVLVNCTHLATNGEQWTSF